MTVKNKIRALPATDEILGIRVGLRLTQEEFAKELEVASRTVQRWEEEGVAPHRGTLKRIRALAALPAPAPAAAPAPSPGGSRHNLHMMLDLILERAPKTIVEDVTAFLFKRAGLYGRLE